MYIHLPFCRKKCFYCAFVAVIGQMSQAGRYVDCLGAEARAFAGRRIKTVFWGGGTPSLLPEPQLQRLMAIINRAFDTAGLIETSMEANPEDITPAKAVFLKKLGITRVSLGIQTFHDRHLKSLGRCHDRHQAYQAFENLRAAGFDNLNVDMMFALPGQTEDDVRADIKNLKAMNPDHVSYYALNIEKPSRFCVQGPRLPDESEQVRTYTAIIEALRASSLEQYEISNFARPGKRCRHNENYWRGGDYIGLGVGAHSHLDGRRSWNVGRLKEYVGRIECQQDPREGEEMLSPAQRLRETLTFGLRMNEGVELKSIESDHQCAVDAGTLEKIETFIQAGFLVPEGHRIKATDKGRLVLDEIASYLI